MWESASVSVGGNKPLDEELRFRLLAKRLAATKREYKHKEHYITRNKIHLNSMRLNTSILCEQHHAKVGARCKGSFTLRERESEFFFDLCLCSM